MTKDPPGTTAEAAGENHALVRFTFFWFEELEGVWETVSTDWSVAASTNVRF